MTPEDLRRHRRLDGAGQRLLDSAFEQLGLSVRALDRVLKVARIRRRSPRRQRAGVQFATRSTR